MDGRSLGGARSEIRRVPVRQGRRPGHDRGAAVLHRVRRRHEQRATAHPAAQLHPRLLPLHRRQSHRTLGPAHRPRPQKGTPTPHPPSYPFSLLFLFNSIDFFNYFY